MEFLVNGGPKLPLLVGQIIIDIKRQGSIFGFIFLISQGKISLLFYG